MLRMTRVTHAVSETPFIPHQPVDDTPMAALNEYRIHLASKPQCEGQPAHNQTNPLMHRKKIVVREMFCVEFGPLQYDGDVCSGLRPHPQSSIHMCIWSHSDWVGRFGTSYTDRTEIADRLKSSSQFKSHTHTQDADPQWLWAKTTFTSSNPSLFNGSIHRPVAGWQNMYYIYEPPLD